MYSRYTLNLIAQTLPVIPGWRGWLILVRFCSEAVASMAAALASAIEWRIESRVNRLLGDFIEKMFGA
jgi:hypothetical protein